MRSRFVAWVCGGMILLLAAVGGAAPGDTDLNGLIEEADQVLVQNHILGVSVLGGEALANADANEDGNVDVADLAELALKVFGPPRLIESSPKAGEGDVAVTRETILTFDKPLDPASLIPTSVFARFGQKTLPARLHLSPDGKRLTLFYDEPLPPSARVRVTINGAQLRSIHGVLADGDLNGTESGTGFFDFDTLSLTPVPSTVIVGRVFASELGMMGGAPVDVPLEGVTISVDGMDDVFAVTDAMGNYRLEGIPAGKFFVHINGHTVTTAMVDGMAVPTSFPAGPYYPNVGKSFEAVAGQETQMIDLYLPLVPEGTLQPVSNTEDTVIHFPQSVIDDFPQFEDVQIIVPAGSLFSDDGTMGGMVGIAPVPPDRIPGRLPEELEFPVVISVQTDGATNFDTPVQVCFPNLPNIETGMPLPAGSKSALWSFNHDTGEFEISGSMTVSDDGLLVCSDPGVGIPAPGWHGTDPGSEGEGGGADEECEEEGSGVGPAASGDPIRNQSAFGPITSSRSFSFPSQFTFSVPSVDGMVTWFTAEGSPQAGSGFTFVTNFCTPGTKTVNAILVESCGSTPQTVSITVEVTLEELGPPLEFVEIANPSTPQPFQPGEEISFRTNFSGFNPPPMNGTIAWNAPGGNPSSFTPSGFNRGTGFTTTFCNPGTYIVTAQFTDLCGQVSTMSAEVQIQGSPACNVPSYFAPFSSPRVGDIVSIAALSNSLFDFFEAGESVRFIAPDGDPSMATFNGPGTPAFSSGNYPTFQTAYVTPGLKTVTVEFTTKCGTVCSTNFNFNVQGSFGIEPSLSEPPAPYPESSRFPNEEEFARIERSARNLGLIRLEARMRQLIPEGRRRATGSLFFAATNMTNGFVTRGRGGAEGVVHVQAIRLASNTEYQESVLHGPSLKIATVSYTTPSPGSSFEIPRFALEPDTSPDPDGDGIGDTGEFILGTDPNNPDTDGDGVNDGAEVRQGLNPSDGLAVPTGIVASGDTPGTALDICTIDNIAIVADGEAGVTVFNIFAGLNPIRIAQVDTPGNAQSVACSGPLIAVADGPEGLAIIDISDPPAARIVRQISFGIETLSVAAGAGIAFVGLANDEVVKLEMDTGLEIGRLTLTSEPEDLVLAGSFLYAHLPNQIGRVSAIPLNGPFEVASSSNPAEAKSQNAEIRERIFAGGTDLYTVHISGFHTFNIAEPSMPLAIASGESGQFAWRQIVLNGAGLGVAAVGLNSDPESGTSNIHLYDTSDPADADNFLLEIQTPGVANAVSIFNGLAYAADGPAGMQVINYLLYDTGATAPTIQLVTNFAPGFAEEGQIVTVTALVDDDVQVRNVEFYLDGELQLVDGGFPFEFRFISPRIADQPTFTIGAIATDTGGNSTNTGQILITLTEDATQPMVVSFSPANGAALAPGSTSIISAAFDEPMNPASLNASTFVLTNAGADGTFDTGDEFQVSGGTVNYNAASQTVSLIFGTPLLSGNYRAEITSGATDLKGNPAEDETWTFSIQSPQALSHFPADGSTVPSGTITAVYATFNSPLQPATISPARVRLLSAGGDLTLGTEDDVLVAGQAVNWDQLNRRLSILMPSPLRADSYRVFVSSAIADLFGSPLGSDLTWTFTVEAPRVIAVSPPHESLRNVNRISQITATFNSDMDSATIDASSFLVFSAGADGMLNTTDDEPIAPESIEYDSPRRRATMHLPIQLGLGKYRGAITTAAANVIGDHLAADFNWSFEIVIGPYDRLLFANPALPMGVTSGGAAIADFNLDGISDIAVAQMEFQQQLGLRVYLGDRQGMFLPGVDYTAGITPYNILARDFDGDGDPDIVGAQNPFAGSSVRDSISVLLNNGDGTFGDPTLYQTDVRPYGLAAGDLDGDFDLDLAVTNMQAFPSEIGTLSVLLNNGDGTFVESLEFDIGHDPHGIAIEDFDLDGDLDLAVVNREAHLANNPGRLLIYHNLGNATFAEPFSHNLGVFAQEIAVGRINGDAMPDLAVTNPTFGASSNFELLFGNADGTFDAPVALSATVDVRGVGLADFNFDGFADLLAPGSSSPNDSTLVRFGNGDGSFEPEILLLTAGAAFFSAAGDLNQSGGPDILTTRSGTPGDARLHFGSGDGSFEPFPTPITLPGFTIGKAFSGDFNNDMHTDVLFQNPFADGEVAAVKHAFSLALGMGNGTFDVQPGPDIGLNSEFPRDVVIADFNGDTIPDAATCNGIFQGMFSPGSMTVFINDGMAAFTMTSELQVATGGDVIAIGAGRLDADADVDILVSVLGTAPDPFTLQTFLNDGSGNFTSGPEIVLEAAPTAIDVEDVNGDTIPDIITAGGDVAFPATDNTFVLLGNGDGTFQNPAAYPGGRSPCRLAVADFTDDGILDLLVATDAINTEESVRLLTGIGNGTFQDEGTFKGGGSLLQVTAGDLDGDGRLDAVTASHEARTIGVLLGRGDLDGLNTGQFARQPLYATGAFFLNGVALGDFDEDGDLDAAIAINIFDPINGSGVGFSIMQNRRIP